MNRPEALKQIELAEPYAQDRVFTNFRGDGRAAINLAASHQCSSDRRLEDFAPPSSELLLFGVMATT